MRSSLLFHRFASMGESVMDILIALQSLRLEVESLSKTIESQCKEISLLNRNIQRLSKENTDLRNRLSKYEKPPKNSSDSSIS